LSIASDEALPGVHKQRQRMPAVITSISRASLMSLAWQTLEPAYLVADTMYVYVVPSATLQLWHRSNWHWYLKHEQLSSLPDAAGCLSVAWDDALPGRLHLMAGSGSYSVLDYQWEVAISSRGTAAVIDGHTLLLTPLRYGG
jgi:elongator complex protein 1